VGAKCWDQMVESYSIPTTERNVRTGYSVLKNDGYEGVNSMASGAINVLDSSPGVYLLGRLWGPVIMSERPP
jgi:hypothetical protein